MLTLLLAVTLSAYIILESSSVILEPLSTSRQADGFDLAVTQRCPTMIFALCFTGQYVARTDLTRASLPHAATSLGPWGECFRKEQLLRIESPDSVRKARFQNQAMELHESPDIQ